MITKDNLPPDAKMSIEMLKKIFPNWDSEELVDTFVHNYNRVHEKYISKGTSNEPQEK